MISKGELNQIEWITNGEGASALKTQVMSHRMGIYPPIVWRTTGPFLRK